MPFLCFVQVRCLLGVEVMGEVIIWVLDGTLVLRFLKRLIRRISCMIIRRINNMIIKRRKFRVRTNWVMVRFLSCLMFFKNIFLVWDGGRRIINKESLIILSIKIEFCIKGGILKFYIKMQY